METKIVGERNRVTIDWTAQPVTVNGQAALDAGHIAGVRYKILTKDYIVKFDRGCTTESEVWQDRWQLPREVRKMLLPLLDWGTSKRGQWVCQKRIPNLRTAKALNGGSYHGPSGKWIVRILEAAGFHDTHYENFGFIEGKRAMVAVVIDYECGLGFAHHFCQQCDRESGFCECDASHEPTAP